MPHKEGKLKTMRYGKVTVTRSQCEEVHEERRNIICGLSV